MKTPASSKGIPVAPAAIAAPALGSLRSMYAEAMRDVMADPRKALTEHDPGLAAWLIPASRGRLAKA
jgi:hypothetical protein